MKRKWYEVVKDILNQRGIKHYELMPVMSIAGKTPVTKAAISHYLNGRRSPSLEQIKQLANFLKMSVDEMLQNAEITYENSESVHRKNLIENSEYVRVPILTAAEVWDYIKDPLQEAHEMMFCPVPHGDNTISMLVNDDSMTSSAAQRSYPPGSIVYFDRDREPKNGASVLAKIAENDDVIFRTYREDAGKKYLAPINPTYRTIELTALDAIVAVAIFAGMPE